MKLLSRLLGLGLLSVLLLLLAMSCESMKPSTNEYGSPNRIKGAAV